MTVGGWITMSVSMGAFAILFVWCMYKVLTSEKPKRKNNRKNI